MKSYIIEIIKKYDNWKEVLAEKSIRIKEESPFAIFNYEDDADPSDPVVREARGIIIDLDRVEVACWPFTRFYNSFEEAAREDLEKFDWNHCRAEEKIDGSICKCWFNKYTKQWQWSTNSCINAADATTFSGHSFLSVIQSAVNYNNIIFEVLDEDMTYIFELVSPLHQIVIRYPTTLLYHIGTRSNVTGEEDWRYIGMLHPEVYPLRTLEDCLDAVQVLNSGESVGGEGFVIVDKYWRRLKIKSPEYVAAHRIRANMNVSKKHILAVLRECPGEIDGLCENFPDLAVYYRYYQFKLAELEHDVGRFIEYARGLLVEFNGDKKAVAMAIKKFTLAPFGFEALKSNADAKQLVAEVLMKRLCRLIPDYTENDVIHMEYTYGVLNERSTCGIMQMSNKHSNSLGKSLATTPREQ
jgi:hypothetical protein